jgi:uncharacterized protein (TIGR02996 family)
VTTSLAERALLETIGRSHGNDAPWLVFADWLHEQGRPAQAEAIRLSLAIQHARRSGQRPNPVHERELQLVERKLDARTVLVPASAGLGCEVFVQYQCAVPALLRLFFQPEPPRDWERLQALMMAGWDNQPSIRALATTLSAFDSECAEYTVQLARTLPITMLSLTGEATASALAGLAELRLLEQLQLPAGSAPLLPRLNELAVLERLDLSDCTPHDDQLAVLPQLSSLRELALDARLLGAGGGSSIGRCSTLHDLRLDELGERDELPDLSWLANLQQLITLSITEADDAPFDPGYVAPIARLGQLRELWLSLCDEPERDIGALLNAISVPHRLWLCGATDPLPFLPRHLMALQLTDCRLDSGLFPIQRLSHLRELTLQVRLQPAELLPLRQLGELEALTLGEVDDEHLAVIGTLQQLRRLEFDASQVTRDGLARLATLDRLEHLVLDGRRWSESELSVLNELRCGPALLELARWNGSE